MIVVFLTATNFFYLNFFPQFPRRCWSFWFHLSCGSFFFLPVLWRRLLCFIWCFFFLSPLSLLFFQTLFLLFDLHPHLYSVGWPHKRLHTNTHRHIHTLWDECTSVYSAHYSSFTLHSHAPTLPELLVLFCFSFCSAVFSFSLSREFFRFTVQTFVCIDGVYSHLYPPNTHTHTKCPS